MADEIITFRLRAQNLAGREVANFQNTLGGLNKTASGMTGLLKAAGGIYAVKTAFDATLGASIEWESQFAGVEKTVDGTDAELAKLEGTLLEMNRTMPIAGGELAEIAEAAGALGIKTDDIASFTKTVAMIGETTNVSSDEAASALGKLSNILGLTAQDYDRFGATLVDLGNKGASTEAEILGIAERAGAGSALIGMAADETLGWSAAVANLGIEAEAGGSSLQKFFLESTKFVGEAGDELDTMAETAGMSSAAFAEAFGKDASGALATFTAGLGELDQNAQIATLGMLGFNDVRITRTLLGLAGNADNLTNALEVGNDAWKSNTALTEEYGKRADTTASKIEVLFNRVSLLGARVGDSQGGIFNQLIAEADTFLTSVEETAWGVGAATQAIAGHFGEQNTALSKLAEDSGTSFEKINNAVAIYMADTGASFDIALEQIGLYGAGNIESLKASEAAWESYQATITPAVQGIATEIGAGATRGRSIWATEMDGMTEDQREEFAKQRELAIESMATVLGNLNDSLRDGKEAYKASWQDYLDGQAEPFTTAQRNAFIAGQFTGTEFDTGLHSKDPEHVANTVEYVNAQLDEFEVLNPGVLEIGKDVPANLQAGMAEIMPELQKYVQDKTGETLQNLTLTEAQELGVDGIWQFWKGMQSEEINATAAARNIALRSKEAMSAGDWYGGGANVGVAWANGLRSSAAYVNQVAWEVAAAANPALHGLSPPKEGPLSDIDVGGFNVGKAWADGFSKAGGYVGRKAAGLAAMASDNLDVSMGALNPTSNGSLITASGASMAGHGAGRSANVTINVNAPLGTDAAAAQLARLLTPAIQREWSRQGIK